VRVVAGLGLAGLVCAVVTGASSAAGGGSREQVLPALATRGIGVARLGSAYRPSQNYNRYGYVIVGTRNAAAAGRLKAKALVYMSGTSVQHRFFTGVSHEEALRRNWLLKDSSGEYLENLNYETDIGDVGNPAYQQQWADNVARFLTLHHDDGVFIDDVVADVGQLTDYAYPPQYPDQQAWQNAMFSFIKYVGASLKAKGFYVVVSATGRVRGDVRSNNGELTRTFWQKLAPYVSGLFSEYWLQLGSDPATLRVAGSSDWRQWWGSWQGLVQVAQRAGVDFFAEMYGSGDDLHIMRYGRASFLLDWNGRGGAFIYQPDEGRSDPWNPEWTMTIGLPVGPKRRVGVGWRRDYTAGVTLVNPSPSASQSFALGGTYFRADGTAVTSISLDPGSAIILRR
jgi:hypothetical protein